MSFPDFLNQLVKHGPFTGADDAQRALTTALEALGYLLPARLVRELEAALPAQCTSSLRLGEAVSASRRARGPESVARAPGALSGATLERVQEVCAVLAAILPPALVESVVREMPAQLSEAFEPRELPGLTPVRRGLEPTLAGGRPGALHPISEAQTGSAHALSNTRPQRAQRGSLGEANPHGDSKLSSARGTTQEREHETLAEWRPTR